MKWSEITWQKASPIYEKILQLPFIEELIQGTLPEEKFFFYLRQDAAYLTDYTKVSAAIAAKLPKQQDTEIFLNFASNTIVVEKSLHEFFLKGAQLDSDTEVSPTCLLYTSYLLRQLVIAPVEEIVAAVLPCFWIYQKVGEHILSTQKKENNPYQSWINTYAGEDFGLAVKIAIEITDTLAEQCTSAQQKCMTKKFIQASKFEWMFWDSAYSMEGWEI